MADVVIPPANASATGFVAAARGNRDHDHGHERGNYNSIHVMDRGDRGLSPGEFFNSQAIQTDTLTRGEVATERASGLINALVERSAGDTRELVATRSGDIRELVAGSAGDIRELVASRSGETDRLVEKGTGHTSTLVERVGGQINTHLERVNGHLSASIEKNACEGQATTVAQSQQLQNLMIQQANLASVQAQTFFAATNLAIEKTAAAQVLEATKNAAASTLLAVQNHAAAMAAAAECCCELKELIRADGDKTRDLVTRYNADSLAIQLADAKAKILQLSVAVGVKL